MMHYATVEDSEELYHAMLVGPGWQLFLNQVVRPEIKRLRTSALTNSNLGEVGHVALVRQLEILKLVLFNAYKSVNAEVPKELLSWFE